MQTNQQPVQYVPATPPPQRRSQRRGCGCLGGAILGVIVLVLLVGVGGAAAAGGLVYANWSREIETGVGRLATARERETFETTQIMDRNGEVLWEIFGEGKRTRVPLDQIPPQLVQATIAVEDDTFYENIGLDAPSLRCRRRLQRPQPRCPSGRRQHHHPADRAPCGLRLRGARDRLL